MTYYGAKELADSFLTVRRNTIQVAEDIPADKYGYKATPDVRSAGEMLAHLAATTLWAHELHGVEKKSAVDHSDFMRYMSKIEEATAKLKTKDQIVKALKDEGDKFAAWMGGLSDGVLAERVSFPETVSPPSKTRFEMLMSVKEHEMHHRAQLMLIERLLGIVPHLTRRMEERAAAATAQS